MVLQLLLGKRTLCCRLKLPDVGWREDPSEWEARSCGSGPAVACDGPLGSVLLLDEDGDVIVVVVLVSLQTAKDASSPNFFSCVQATLGVVGKQSQLLSISLTSTYLFATNCVVIFFLFPFFFYLKSNVYISLPSYTVLTFNQAKKKLPHNKHRLMLWMPELAFAVHCECSK